MAKKTNPKTFTYTPTYTLPKLGKLKTEWDLTGLYYKNENDPKLEADVVAAEKAYAGFVKKWQKKDVTKSAKVLAQALTEYETLTGLAATAKPGRYLSLRLALNVNDSIATKRLALLSKRYRELSDSMLFFPLAIASVPKSAQKSLLAAKELARFRYYLVRTFIGADHKLTEAEEKIISLKSAQSYGMWVDMVEKIISSRTVQFKHNAIAIPEALERISTLSAADKKELWAAIITQMKQIGEVAEHEFNAIITDVRTEDKKRGYQKPYSATAIGYEDTEASIENLVASVSTTGFALSKKFYKLKAQYHGVPSLHYTQKYDSIGDSPSIPYEQAVEICRDVFYSVKPLYGEIFDEMLTTGKIDAYPKPSKRGGAFMSDATNLPTQVFLNHLPNMKSLETLAHEMGHAIHAHRSKTNTPLYDGHSISTAETASTLFENLLFDAVYEQAAAGDKVVLMHDRITRDIATIQRQIAFFNAELEIHNTIEREGAMTNAELANCMQRHLKSYLGSAVDVSPDDGYSYVYVSHLRYGFYVYTYSFGLLMSTIMANHYAANHDYVESIDTFLCAGSSDTVANIFKKIGIDTTKADTYNNALQNHAGDIKAFAKLVKTAT